MTKEELEKDTLATIAGVALDASWKLLGGPKPLKDDDRKLVGESMAKSFAACAWISEAKYDHAARAIDVLFVGRREWFRVPLAIGGKEGGT